MPILDELKKKANGKADGANNIAEAIAQMDFSEGSVTPEEIADSVSAYLDEHLTNPTNPPIDTSLSIAGAAADAKKTGDKITQLKEGLSELSGIETIAFTSGAYIKNDSTSINLDNPTVMSDTAYAIVDCQPGDEFTVWGTGLGAGHLWCWVNSNNEKISRSAISVTTPTVITAPQNAVKLILDVITLYDYGAYKGESIKVKVENNTEALNDITSATSDAVGKALSPKTVSDGKVTEWQYVETSSGETDDSKIGLTPITDLTVGKYIKTNDSVVDITTEFTNSGMAYTVIDCNEGDAFLLKGTGVSYAYVFCFIDDTGKRYTYRQNLANLQVVVAPYGATKLVLNASTVYAFEFYKGTSLFSRMSTVENSLDLITSTHKIVPSFNGYINTNNSPIDPTTPAMNSDYAYAVVPCQSGDLFTIWGTGASYAYLYCFIDSNGTAIKKEQSVSAPKLISAPNGASMLIVNQILAYDFGFYKGRFLGEASYIAGSQWIGKTVATFGDSITWYNGRPFGSGHSEEGQTAIGYQHYLEDLGITIVNKGMSGYRMDQILSVIKASTVSDYDCVTITCGANDFRYPTTEPLGEIAPIGSSFDEGTMIGALQSAIEWLISTKPNIRIFLITPIKGFDHGSVMPETYPQAFLDVGKLYSLPVCDWYYKSGINSLNKDTYIGDDEAQTRYKLHPTNAGFKLMGEMLRGFFEGR